MHSGRMVNKYMLERLLVREDSGSTLLKWPFQGKAPGMCAEHQSYFEGVKQCMMMRAVNTYY